MCYPPDESNSILQMKTTFKKINPRNKLGVSFHSIYKSTNYNYNNYQKPQDSREYYKISPTLPPKINIIYYICRKRGHEAFQCKKQKDFCDNIRTYSKGQTYFFTLGYDIVLDKSNLLVNCRATEYVITDKSKFINFDQNFEPGNHFVELADENRANNIVLKRGNACIYLHGSKGQM